MSLQLSPAYVAGLFDGEGCVVLCRSNGTYSRSVAIAGCYLPIIEALQATWGGSLSKKANPTKACFYWQLSGKKRLINFLETILPYLNEKREQAQILLDICYLPSAHSKDWVKERLDTAYVQLRTLKQFDYASQYLTV